MPPLLARILRVALVSSGAVTAVMAVVNIVATAVLIQPFDEAEMGITRWDFFWWYGVTGAFGLAMVAVGIFWRKRR